MVDVEGQARLQRWSVMVGVVLAIAGLALGTLYPARFAWATTALEMIGGFLSTIAPLIIFATLTPAIGGLIRARSVGRFSSLVVLTYVTTTALAGLWALIFAWGFFGLGVTGQAGGIGAALGDIGARLGPLVTQSWPVKAIFLGVVGGIFAGYSDTFAKPFDYVFIGIEKLGDALVYLLPVLLFLMGAGIPGIARGAAERVPGGGVTDLGPVGNLFFEGGLTGLEGYIFVIVATALLAIPWMLAFAFVVSRHTRDFTVREFLAEHTYYVYPFAFSTASSSATIPVNLDRVGDALDVRKEIREFIVPLGATVNMDGTMISAVVITVVSAMMVGYRPSVLDLLITIVPLVVVTVGVPGIPGGLAAVVGAILAGMFPLGPSAQVAFFNIYLALSIGLGDQIRTGVNVSDDALICKLFDHHFADRFAPLDEGLPVTLEEIEDPEAQGTAGTREP